MISQHNKEALKNPWVLGMLLFVCVFVSVNAFMIYNAVSKPPNLVVKNYYERGKVYMHQTQESLKALGWSGNILAPLEARVNQTVAFDVLLQGPNAAPVAPDRVLFFAFRPSDARQDFSVEMDLVQTGLYRANMEFPLPGRWDLLVEAQAGEDTFAVVRQFFISP